MSVVADIVLASVVVGLVLLILVNLRRRHDEFVQSCPNWPHPHMHEFRSAEWFDYMDCPYAKLRRIERLEKRMEDWRQRLRNEGATEDEIRKMEGSG